MTELPYAEDINYWKTSKSSPDTWVDRAKRQIEKLGGTILTEAFGTQLGRSAFMLHFEIGEDQFKVVWPALSSRAGNDRAAKIQAATLLYHDVKAKVIKASVFGSRVAFFEHWLLPNGRTTAEASVADLMKGVPQLLLGNAPRQIETPDNVVEGEIIE